MWRRRIIAIAAIALGTAFVIPATSGSAFNADTKVTVGSPAGPFAQNKQNEPAVAVDANHPNILAAGANEEIDNETCNAGDPTTCPFTTGIGDSGIYFSLDSGDSWIQPTYTGWSARDCTGPAACSPSVGPIGTVPWYYENGLVSDGDPAVAFGPAPDGHGGFSWATSRLYYANLTSNFGATRTDQAFKGFEAIAVSRTDDVAAAANGDKNAWKPPVLISKQSSTTFSDKEQIWADNVSHSKFFGNVYVCWASFVGQELGRAAPAPLMVGTSRDGGDTWTVRQVSSAANNSERNPLDGCTIRTDSHGNVYVFGIGTLSSSGRQPFEFMVKSTNGGATWGSAVPVAGPIQHPGILDPVQGRLTEDGIAGARNDLSTGPSVDIANGAPDGADATNRIVMSYVDGTTADPHVEFTESSNGGSSWSTPRHIETLPGDNGLYAAPAISPNGGDVYVVYNAFTTPYRENTTDPRSLVGVVLHADSGLTGATGAFTEIHRGEPGDPRGSSANALTDEFLGDYVYAAATRDYGAAVWNDVRDAADCPAIDAWRMSLNGGPSAPKPAPEADCPATFGNSDIYGGTYPDPTP